MDDYELPAEAVGLGRPFEPDDEWLEHATPEQQVPAMIQWFRERYEDPAQETPWDSELGEYVFVHGGPYDPSDVIQDRFGEIVDYAVMAQAISALVAEVGHQWAPIAWEDDTDYDRELAMRVTYRSDPMRILESRLAEIEHMLVAGVVPGWNELAVQLAHGAAITGLEAYLWDTTSYWTTHEEVVFRQFISTNAEFGKEKIAISTIFSELDGLKEKFSKYLQDLVWHRLDKIKPMMERGFDIALPDVGPLMEQVVIRHHIIHRGGRDKNGEIVAVSLGDVAKVIELVRAFAETVEAELERRFPKNSKWFDVFDEDIPF